MNLSELRAAASQGFNSFKSGQYTSLPLEGRVDLLMPKPKPRAAVTSALSPPKSPSAISSPTINAPPPQSFQQQTERPATWDASRYSPPVHGQPEMAIPMNAHYQPAWEQPSSQQGSYYSQRAQAEPQYPTLPDNVRRDEWYKQYHGRVPDRSNVHAVFPWEEKGHGRPAAGRVFPRGDTPPPIRLQAATPDAATPRPSSPQSQSGPQQRSMAEAMASYTNAWDNVPQIGKYVKRLSNIGLTKDMRQIQNNNLKSVPGTPSTGSFDFGLSKSGGTMTDTSADGDDEGDDTDDDEDPEESPIVGHGQSGIFAPQPGFSGQYQYQGNADYRDRQAQTEQSEQNDAKVQAIPGGGPSPAVRTIPLPASSNRSAGTAHAGQGHSRRSSRAQASSSSSSETARQQSSQSSLVTPSSDTRVSSSGTVHHSAPLPDYAFHKGVGAEHNHQGDQGGNGGGKQSGRVWDPNTDVDQRKRDSQDVLSRFMKSGGFGK